MKQCSVFHDVKNPQGTPNTTPPCQLTPNPHHTPTTPKTSLPHLILPLFIHSCERYFMHIPTPTTCVGAECPPHLTPSKPMITDLSPSCISDRANRWWV